MVQHQRAAFLLFKSSRWRRQNWFQLANLNLLFSCQLSPFPCFWSKSRNPLIIFHSHLLIYIYSVAKKIIKMNNEMDFIFFEYSCQILSQFHAIFLGTSSFLALEFQTCDFTKFFTCSFCRFSNLSISSQIH